LDNLSLPDSPPQRDTHTAVGLKVVDQVISEADIARSRSDPRFKQVLLAQNLERLLARLYRLQHGPAPGDAASARELREGAMMAVQVADLIRAIDDKLSSAPVKS
jgi:hypothetical protein